MLYVRSCCLLPVKPTNPNSSINAKNCQQYFIIWNLRTVVCTYLNTWLNWFDEGRSGLRQKLHRWYRKKHTKAQLKRSEAAIYWHAFNIIRFYVSWRILTQQNNSFTYGIVSWFLQVAHLWVNDLVTMIWKILGWYSSYNYSGRKKIHI